MGFYGNVMILPIEGHKNYFLFIIYSLIKSQATST